MSKSSGLSEIIASINKLRDIEVNNDYFGRLLLQYLMKEPQDGEDKGINNSKTYLEERKMVIQAKNDFYNLHVDNSNKFPNKNILENHFEEVMILRRKRFEKQKSNEEQKKALNNANKPAKKPSPAFEYKNAKVAQKGDLFFNLRRQ